MTATRPPSPHAEPSRSAGFFLRLSLSYAIVVLAGTAAVGLLVDARLEAALRRGMEADLERACVFAEGLARRVLDEAPPPARQAWAAQDELEALGQRVHQRLTVVRPDGVVVADSHADPARMENHGQRPEVRDAIESARAGDARFALRSRESNTVGGVHLYAARAVGDGPTPLGVVRASMPLAVVERELDAMHGTLLLGATVGALAALLLGLIAASRITRPLRAMTAAARALRAGDYGARVRELPDDELGELGRVFNELAAETTERIATLQEQQLRLRTVLAAMVETVVAVDEDDRVVFCNDAARAVLDAGEGDLLGARLWERTRNATLVELVQEARRTGLRVQRSLEIERDGREIELDAHASPFRGDQAEGVVLVLHDVTELRRLERIRRDFVANVSHELKTPLTAIQGYVETLLGGAMHEEQNLERFLLKTERHVGRLTHLVKDLLSLARIEAQEGAVPEEPVDLPAVLADVVQRYENDLRSKRLELRWLAPRAPVVVKGDRESVFQVGDNIFGNAVKYTPEGGRIEISFAREPGADGESGWGTFAVSDTGIGIPRAEQKRIFERFYRVDKARSRELGGTGLGLSIVKHLVQAMRGEVSVESAPGRGSRFQVRLPLAS